MIFLVLPFFLLVLTLAFKIADMILYSQQVLWPCHETLANQASCFRADLLDKIEKMRDNPLLSERDFEELREVCRWADAWFVTTHPDFKDEDLDRIQRRLETCIKRG